jgi:hypothetical protein
MRVVLDNGAANVAYQGSARASYLVAAIGLEERLVASCVGTSANFRLRDGFFDCDSAFLRFLLLNLVTAKATKSTSGEHKSEVKIKVQQPSRQHLTVVECELLRRTHDTIQSDNLVQDTKRYFGP